jgi:uncharacterized protein (TIGR00255 family)
MPRAFIAFEDSVRKAVAEYVIRGRVDLFVTFIDNRERPVDLSVDTERALGYYNAAKAISEKLGIINDVTTTTIMKCPDVVTDNSVDNYDDVLEPLVLTVKNACVKLNEMRGIEGKKLIADMLLRMDVISKNLSLIKERAPMVLKEHKERLAERISEALCDVKYDESRLLNEVAFYADKINIDEEITRLSSHIEQFKSIVNDKGVGKKLDFLMQEFNRETNTICSKSNDIKITEYALILKNEIEKVREQVQNLE